jgi:response regulator NasT
MASDSPAPARWRIAVIDDHVPSRTLVTSTLAAAGAVVTEADTAAAGLEMVEGLRPDAVVLAIGLPDRDGVDVATQIMEQAPCAIVLLTSRADGAVVERARLAGAMAYLVKPVRPEELAPAIELAIARFGEWHRASHEAAALRRALADRKLIERAKGLLMRRLAVGEHEAFRMLQKTAMDRRVSMAALADALVKGETSFSAPRKRAPREP